MAVSFLYIRLAGDNIRDAGGGDMSTTAAAGSHAGGIRAARPRRARPAGGGARAATSILLWVGVVATILFCLFPFYWIINTSLKTGAELSQGRLFPPIRRSTTTARSSRTATSRRRCGRA